MSFGKLNAGHAPQLSFQEASEQRARMERRRWAIGLTGAALAVVALGVALNPKLMSLSWWFGSTRVDPLAIAFCGGVAVLCAVANWRTNRRQRQRVRDRGGHGSGSTIDLPDWCTDTTTGGDGCGDGGGGDGGGD